MFLNVQIWIDRNKARILLRRRSEAPPVASQRKRSWRKHPGSLPTLYTWWSLSADLFIASTITERPLAFFAKMAAARDLRPLSTAAASIANREHLFPNQNVISFFHRCKCNYKHANYINFFFHHFREQSRIMQAKSDFLQCPLHTVVHR